MDPDCPGLRLTVDQSLADEYYETVSDGNHRPAAAAREGRAYAPCVVV
ncbi:MULTISPECIES: hypothetical protein [Streptomyces]|nr:hypothetical protein [Streptomyces parvus]